MAYGGWAGWIPDAEANKDEPKPDRDRELENLLGNLLVAHYQVMRLEDKLSTRVGSGFDASTFTFRHGERWYKVNIKIDRQEIEKKEVDDTEVRLDQATESTGP